MPLFGDIVRRTILSVVLPQKGKQIWSDQYLREKPL